MLLYAQLTKIKIKQEAKNGNLKKNANFFAVRQILAPKKVMNQKPGNSIKSSARIDTDSEKNPCSISDGKRVKARISYKICKIQIVKIVQPHFKRTKIWHAKKMCSNGR